MADSQTGDDYTPLPRKTIFFYGLTQVPLAMLLMPLAIYLPNYYARDLGFDLALYGNIILLVMFFDIASDLGVGWLSDRTRSRFGRRRPWIVAGTPLMMAGLYMLFLPSGTIDFWYVFIWTMVMRLGWTMIMIPYYAWGAELSPDYNERTIITGWRAMVTMGSYLAIQIMLVVALKFFDFGGVANIVYMLGVAMMIALPLTVFLTTSQVSEKQNVVPSVMPLIQSLRLTWRNGPFKRLVLAFFMGSVAMSIMMQAYTFFMRDVIEEEQAFVYLMAILYVVTIISVPFWVWLSRHIGKHKAWMASFVVFSVASPFYMLLGAGDLWWVLPISMVTGFATGAYESMSHSMKADVIDIDTIRSRQDRAAWYFSAWSFATKSAGSIATWLAFNGMVWAGYNPALGTKNTEQGLFVVSFTFAIVPVIFFLLALLIVWKYPVTEVRHARIRAVLEKRRIRAEAPGLAE